MNLSLSHMPITFSFPIFFSFWFFNWIISNDLYSNSVLYILSLVFKLSTVFFSAFSSALDCVLLLLMISGVFCCCFVVCFVDSNSGSHVCYESVLSPSYSPEPLFISSPNFIFLMLLYSLCLAVFLCFLFVVFWDLVSPYRSGWPQTWEPLASASKVLEYRHAPVDLACFILCVCVCVSHLLGRCFTTWATSLSHYSAS
jgi:hypothetical protein